MCIFNFFLFFQKFTVGGLWHWLPLIALITHWDKDHAKAFEPRVIYPSPPLVRVAFCVYASVSDGYAVYCSLVVPGVIRPTRDTRSKKGTTCVTSCLGCDEKYAAFVDRQAKVVWKVAFLIQPMAAHAMVNGRVAQTMFVKNC